MIKTIRICDICGKEYTDKDACHIEAKASGTVDSYFGKGIDVCRSCLEKKGFSIIPKGDGSQLDLAKPPQGKTVGDLVLDVLEAAGVQFKE